MVAENTLRLASGMNPQKRRCVGGANSSTTKFALVSRLIPRRGLPREQLAAGIRTRPNFICC